MNSSTGEVKVKQKRGRKPKNKNIEENAIPQNSDIQTIPNIPEEMIQESPLPKKRGRKPKGGKIVTNNNLLNESVESNSNIILHLKCCINDLKEELSENLPLSEVSGFNFKENVNSNTFFLEKNSIESFSDAFYINNNNNTPFDDENYLIREGNNIPEYNDLAENKKKNKEIWNKLKELQKNLHTNNVDDKKSACFWCTYEFDNPPIFIPKHFIKNSYQVYGCFCTPECATAYLMKENIDSTSKFERYYLLNFIYSKIYDFKTNIKPAPNPEYLLDKFYGNLSISEYRSILKSDRLYLVVDKPLSRMLPELHEDNDDLIISSKSIPSNLTYRKRVKKEEKKDIVNKTFGIKNI